MSIQDKRAEAASRFAGRWNERPDLRETAAVVSGLNKAGLAGISSARRQQFSKEEKDLRKAVVAYCNFYEEMAVNIRYTKADEGELVEYFLTPAVEAYGPLAKWIVDERTLLESPGLMENFEWMYKRWKPKRDRRLAKAKRRARKALDQSGKRSATRG